MPLWLVTKNGVDATWLPFDQLPPTDLVWVAQVGLVVEGVDDVAVLRILLNRQMPGWEARWALDQAHGKAPRPAAHKAAQQHGQMHGQQQ